MTSRGESDGRREGVGTDVGDGEGEVGKRGEGGEVADLVFTESTVEVEEAEGRMRVSCEVCEGEGGVRLHRETESVEAEEEIGRCGSVGDRWLMTVDDKPKKVGLLCEVVIREIVENVDTHGFELEIRCREDFERRIAVHRARATVRVDRVDVPTAQQDA